MSSTTRGRSPLARVFVAMLAGLVLASLGVAGTAFAAGSTTKPVSAARTPAWVDGKTVTVQYPQNYFCDKKVSSGAPSGCEVGADATMGPIPSADRSVLYVLVPLFSGTPNPAPMCATASCPNHPRTIDLSRIAGALGADPTALKSVPLPAHSHVLDGPAGGWWETKIVGVLSQDAWAQIAAGKSEATMNQVIASGGAVGPIDSNLYLFFNVIGH